ncbi:MAG TPA: NAD-dependent epimerase/dehydratase family protein [Planctomycetes bacterium]|nr:NAD-dependent epimerase/dehydratase family protein [Planctomycetota bacterium]HIN79817.1 NAD-dependent epimerase/dehydratase family protein [Planctomycetota bacterium]
MKKRAVITGAFSYTGSAVARQLVNRGWTVHTLTNRERPAGAERISTSPLRFDEAHLKNELEGADVFINTYWIRLPWGEQTFDTAVERSKMLFRAAKMAGVSRVVHVSVSNASAGRNLGYYDGKAAVEEALRRSGLSHAIVRPTLIVGPNDVLTNNIAWFLRHFPIFPIPGGGDYRLQPITLEDTARIIVSAIEDSSDVEVDAAGKTVFTFKEYVRLLARACGVRRVVIGVPATLVLLALRGIGGILGDVTLTKEEFLGLDQELLISHESPRGEESVENWLMKNGESLGRRYRKEIHRHFGEGSTMAVLNPGTDPE